MNSPYASKRPPFDEALWADYERANRAVVGRRRLGISLNALNAWCRRHDPDVMERLRLNEARRKGMVA